MGEVLVGPLARAILARYRAPGWTLIGRILERTQASQTGSASALTQPIADGIIFDETDLARARVTADGWFTLGVIRRGPATVFLELSIHSGDARLIFPPDDWSVRQAWRGVLIPADAFLALDGPVGAEIDLGQRRSSGRGAGDGPAGSAAARWERRPSRLTAALDDAALLCQEAERLLAAARRVLEAANRPRTAGAARTSVGRPGTRSRSGIYRVR
jgi:hypothetical protein